MEENAELLRRCSQFVGVARDECMIVTKVALGFHREERAEREMEHASEGRREKSEDGILAVGVCRLPPATKPPPPCLMAAGMARELGSFISSYFHLLYWSHM